MDFCIYIKNVMKEKKIGINQLAEMANVSPGHLSRIINCKSGYPKPDYIKRLAAALEIDASHLLILAGYIEKPLSEECPKEGQDIEQLLKSGDIYHKGNLLSEKLKKKLIKMIDILQED